VPVNATALARPLVWSAFAAYAAVAVGRGRRRERLQRELMRFIRELIEECKAQYEASEADR
jgi:hypothetical protein